jgi:alpha-amylase
MRAICFYFQVHQPYRLKRYRFFDIGKDHYYFDEYANRSIMRKVAEKCYLPANKAFLDLIREYGQRFKICYSISGTALDQFSQYAPDVLESFQRLAETGCVEFLGETYSHGLSSLKSKDEFFEQVRLHTEKVEELFGQKPKVFRNTELIYSDGIGEMVAEMGFKAMLTEGAKHVLGWKSPNYLYCNAINPKLKVLLKNFRLSDDIAFRFSNRAWNEWPLTTEKYVNWLNNIDKKEELVNLFMDYETFGEHQWSETGIFDFLKALPGRVLSHTDFQFMTPLEVAEHFDPVSAIHVPYPISWADEERDLTAWIGNELQDDAFSTLYGIAEKVHNIEDPDIQRDWKYLQTSDHFYYMCTKWFSDGDVHKYFNPWDTPYEAFINFMNAVSDFIIRVEQASEKEEHHEEVLSHEDISVLIKSHETILRKLKSKKPKKGSKSGE